MRELWGSSSACYTRKTQLGDTSISLRWLDSCPPLGGEGQHSPLIPTHSITHIFARCLYIFGSRCLLQPNSCAPKRWKFWQIDLARSPKPFPHKVDNVLARGPPGQNIRLFGSNLIDCFDSHLFSRTFCFALDGQIILLWYGWCFDRAAVKGSLPAIEDVY